MRANEWKLDKGTHKGKTMLLLTLGEFRTLPADTELVCISGEEESRSAADDDTRFGYVAYGLKSSLRLQ